MSGLRSGVVFVFAVLVLLTSCARPPEGVAELTEAVFGHLSTANEHYRQYHIKVIAFDQGVHVYIYDHPPFAKEPSELDASDCLNIKSYSGFKLWDYGFDGLDATEMADGSWKTDLMTGAQYVGFAENEKGRFALRSEDPENFKYSADDVYEYVVSTVLEQVVAGKQR